MMPCISFTQTDFRGVEMRGIASNTQIATDKNLGAVGGQITLNLFTMGGLCRTNSSFVQPFFGGKTVEIWYTNALDGTTVTNRMNEWNKLYKAY